MTTASNKMSEEKLTQMDQINENNLKIVQLDQRIKQLEVYKQTEKEMQSNKLKIDEIKAKYKTSLQNVQYATKKSRSSNTKDIEITE
jgi:hypothetical protein